MGTWEAGPFGNDMAVDFVGGVVQGLMAAVDAFLESPEIDETFDEAFAAVALLNEVMQRTTCRPWDAAAQQTRDPEPIVRALLDCFDQQIDDLEPDEEFKQQQRAALIAECARFRALVAG